MCGTARCILLRPIYTICTTVCNYCYVSIIYVVHVATVQSVFAQRFCRMLEYSFWKCACENPDPRCSTRTIYTCNRHLYEKHA